MTLYMILKNEYVLSDYTVYDTQKLKDYVLSNDIVYDILNNDYVLSDDIVYDTQKGLCSAQRHCV